MLVHQRVPFLIAWRWLPWQTVNVITIDGIQWRWSPFPLFIWWIIMETIINDDGYKAIIVTYHHINWTYPLVNVYITIENHHAMNGNIHYFDWAIFKFANCLFTRGSWDWYLEFFNSKYPTWRLPGDFIRQSSKSWWFETYFFLFSPIVGMMIQSDKLIFFRGIGIPPTSHIPNIQFVQLRSFSELKNNIVNYEWHLVILILISGY